MCPHPAPTSAPLTPAGATSHTGWRILAHLFRAHSLHAPGFPRARTLVPAAADAVAEANHAHARAGPRLWRSASGRRVRVTGVEQWACRICEPAPPRPPLRS